MIENRTTHEPTQYLGMVVVVGEGSINARTHYVRGDVVWGGGWAGIA